MASAVIVVVVILIAGYAVHSSRSSTVTSTATSTGTTTVTSTSIGTSTVTSTVGGKEGPLISWSADAYAPEVTALLNGFSSSTGVQVAPLKSGGSTADASGIAAGAPDDVFVSFLARRDLLPVPR